MFALKAHSGGAIEEIGLDRLVRNRLGSGAVHGGERSGGRRRFEHRGAFPVRMPERKPADPPIGAATARLYDLWNPLGDNYYVWHTRRKTALPPVGLQNYTDDMPDDVPARDWDLADIYITPRPRMDSIGWNKECSIAI
ncbi:MAG: hypothetical protein BWZ10_00619 [candidate division BRC1 bacterium ADurb.BinA364]|nr:MAG: hypothetical protein BWZ10_00619 [candidate division BRC1 bacterium ADurb.BinA364]